MFDLFRHRLHSPVARVGLFAVVDWSAWPHRQQQQQRRRLLSLYNLMLVKAGAKEVITVENFACF
jgi:hypothetical protein